jgi:hypothetical protein
MRGATGNREYFLNKPHSLAGNARLGISHNYPNAVCEVLVVLVERANRLVEIAALKCWLERKVAQQKGECCAESRRAALKFGSPQRVHVLFSGLNKPHSLGGGARRGDTVKLVA